MIALISFAFHKTDVLSNTLNFNGTPMQFDRYIFWQLIRTTFAVTSVLVGIVWLFQTIKLLELVVNKGASIGDFILMSVAVMPLWLTIAMPIGAFVALQWVFHRIISDRELTVMQAVGLSPMQIARAPIYFGTTITLMLMVNSSFILPNSFALYKEMQFQIRNSIPTILLQDGVFIDIVDGMTILIGKRPRNGVAEDVFIHDARDADKVTSVTAKYGKFINDRGVPKLILQNGQRAELSDDGSSSALLLFDTHTLSITPRASKPATRSPIDMNEDNIVNLLNPDKSPAPRYYPERRAEGHYRIISPFLGLALVMMTLAITLRGQIRRDLWLRRSFVSIAAGLSLIMLTVVTRGLIASHPIAIPLIYTIVLLPCIVSLVPLLGGFEALFMRRVSKGSPS